MPTDVPNAIATDRRLAAATEVHVPLLVTASVDIEEHESKENPVEIEKEGAGLTDVGEDWFATGFLNYPVEWIEDPLSYGAGFSMHVAAWPMQETYPGAAYQSGLPGTWMHADAATDREEIYSTIEGGLGWWNDTRFATETPKFIMGGVSREFMEWANGPGAGAGFGDVDRRDWDEPQGKYGVAQLSPYVLWAPDGLNLKDGTNGELFGYGYHPLPLIDTQVETNGLDVSTGNQSWTLFLNTGNFKGPVSFFIPNFFTKPVLEDPSLEGIFLDTSPSGANRGISMETQVIPAVHATDAEGTSYARITQIQFPVSGPDTSIILSQPSVYSHAALWNNVDQWWNSDAAVLGGAFDPEETHLTAFTEGADSSYIIIYEGIAEDEEYYIDWDALATPDLSDPYTFKYRWNMDLVTQFGDNFHLPEYYRLEQEPDGDKVWTPILVEDVPEETGLQLHEFEQLGVRNDAQPFVTPEEPDSIWQSPGPVAGPFQAELGDGSIVTYSWYRFVDQPAILYWDFSAAEREALQARVEAIHRHWMPDQAYLASPAVGELADLDPNIIVTPPAGLEIGYVPIVTRQEKATE